MRMIQLVMRESKAFLLGYYQRHEPSLIGGGYPNFLVMFTYLTAIGVALSIGHIKTSNDLDLFVILFMLVTAIPLLRNGNRLNQPSRTTGWSKQLRTAEQRQLTCHKTRTRRRRQVLPRSERLSGWWHPLKR